MGRTYRMVDGPRAVERTTYDRAVARMVDRLRWYDGVQAVFQIGGVSTPGISDLDMVVVFEDEVSCSKDPRAALLPEERYLFTHSLYGAPRSLFLEAQCYSFFHHYTLLHGEDPRPAKAPPPKGAEALKQQIALEYMLRMYMTLTRVQTYRMLKVRSFLLHVKAIAYDLEFLGIQRGELAERTRQFVAWRQEWFNNSPSSETLAETLRLFCQALKQELDRQLPGVFCMPALRRYRLSRNMWMAPGDCLGYTWTGVRLPFGRTLLGARYLKVQNRLSRLLFAVPMRMPPSDVLRERFDHVDRLREYNQASLPHFAPLSSSLHAE